MRRNAFTLVEMMAVVALLGMLAGATVWWLARDARQASRRDVVGQITHADRMARMAAERLDAPCVLRFDLDGQRVVRVARGEAGDERPSHSLKLPSGYRIERMAMPQESFPDGGRRNASTAWIDDGAVEIAYSAEGCSISYALRLSTRRSSGSGAAGDAARDEEWIVFSGLTGQAVTVHDEDEVDRVFAALATGRTYAH